ncbi:TetR/AcrR family transcriptional regulator [Myceligenerans halotolerans]
MAEPLTLRADARRNREQIIAAAKAVFAERGPDVPMEEIARRAGVGVGTLYRRFADRDTLIREVARDSFAVLRAHAQHARADGGQGWESFLKILQNLPDLWFTLRLTVLSADYVSVIRNDQEGLATAEEFMSAFHDLVRIAQDEGTIRPDVGTGDVMMLITLVITGLRTSSSTLPDDVYQRMLALSLDSLRPGARAPLPGHPLGPEHLEPRA